MIALDDLRDYLGILSDQHGDDALLETLETEAVSIVETGTNIRYSATGTVVEFIRGNGLADLFLSGSPTADPSEVLEATAIGETGAAVTDWVRRSSRLVRTSGGVWTLDYEYKVTYTGGYAANAEPPVVRNAVKQIVAILYRGRGKEGQHSETTGPTYAYTKDEEAIARVLESLPHRPVFA